MNKIHFIILILLINVHLFSLVFSEKIIISQKLQETAELIESSEFDKAKTNLNKIKNDYYDTEFVAISYYLLAKIEYVNKNYYKALYYISMTLEDNFFEKLILSYKTDIHYIAGLIYYKIENYPEAVLHLNYCLNDKFTKKNSALLLLSEICGRKTNEFGKASLCFSQINKSKLTSEEIDKYNYLASDILWSKIDTSKIGCNDPNVSSIVVDKDVIYIGLYNGGLIEYNYILDSYTSYIYNIISGNIRNIYVDYRNIYIGTAEGVSILDKRDGSLENVDFLKGKSINCITGDDEFVYFGTLGDGVIAYNKKSREYSKIGNLVNISVLFLDDDKLYIATYNGSLYYLNNGSLHFMNVYIHKKHPVTDIVRYDNELFLATYGDGIYKYNLVEKDVVKYSSANKDFDDDYFLCITKSKDRIYCGTLGMGIYTFDLKKNQWERFDISDLYMGTDIRKIVFTEDFMFLATLGEGVLRKAIEKKDQTITCN